MKESVSVHHPIIYNGLRDLTPNGTINRYEGPFSPQYKNVNQVKNHPDDNII